MFNFLRKRCAYCNSYIDIYYFQVLFSNKTVTCDNCDRKMKLSWFVIFLSFFVILYLVVGFIYVAVLIDTISNFEEGYISSNISVVIGLVLSFIIFKLIPTKEIES